MGAPLEHQDYVRRFLNKVSEKHQILFQRIPQLSDVQSAWLLLVHCAGTRANNTLRCFDPEAVEAFARRHHQDMFACLCQILQLSPDEVDAETRDSATLPMSLGGLGLRSAVRTSKAAHWACWADCFAMIRERHPTSRGHHGGTVGSPTNPVFCR